MILPPLRLLLIDDNEDAALLIRDLLAGMRDVVAQVEWVSTYETAYVALTQGQYDVCLLDYELGGDRGLELLQALPADSLIPIILLTGTEDHQVDTVAAREGAADYLVKGHINAPLLERSIRYAMGRKKTEAALLQAQRFAQATVDALTGHIAVLDSTGTIIAVNNAWRDFGASNGFIGATSGVGTNYLEVCDQSGEANGRAAASYIRAVMAGEEPVPALEYTCHSPAAQRWFRMSATRFPGDGPLHIVVAHENIAEHRKLETAQHFLASIVESSADSILTIDFDRIITSWNRAAEQLYGYPAAEVLGKPLTMLTLSEDWQEVLNKIDRIKHGETVEIFDTIRVNKDGRELNLEVVLSPVKDMAGQVIGVSTIARDITERKHAEETLLQSQANLAIAQQMAKLGSWEWELTPHEDWQKNRVHWSDEVFRIFGYTPGEVEASFDNFARALPQDERPRIEAITTQALRDRKSYSLDHRVLRPNGTERIVHEQAKFVFDAKGEPIRIVGTVQDITERKQAESALRASEEQFFTAFMHSAVGVALVAPDGRYLKVNQALCQMLGYSEAEMLARSFQDLTHPEDVDDSGRVQQLLTGAIESFQMEKRYIHQRGHEVWGLLTVSSLRDEAGQPVHQIAQIQDITKRKQAESLLLESRQRLALATKAAHIGIWDWDVATNTLLWDAQMYALYGIREPDFSGAYDAWQNGLHPEDRGQAENDVRYALDGSRDFHTQFRVVWPGGEVRYIESHGLVQRAEDGSAVRMIGVNWDITERNQTQEALHRSEALFRTLINSSWDAFQLVAPDGQITYESPAVKRLLGYEPEEMVGHSVAEFVHPDDIERITAEGMAMLDSPGAMRTVTLRVRHKDGSWRWMESFETNLVDHPDVGAFAVNYHDITERKLAEEALRESEAEFRTLAEALPQMVWITRPDGWNIYFSQQWMDYTGLTLDESLGHGWNKPFHPDDQQRAWDAWQHATATIGIYSLECRLRRADGEYRWWLIRGVPLQDAAGKILKWFGTCTDIHDLKLAEQEIARANQQQRELAQQLTMEKSRLVAAQAVAKVGSWETDVETGAVAWSDETYRIFETDPNNFEPTHQGFLQKVHPDDRAMVAEAFAQSLGSRSAFALEHRIPMSDGRIKTVEERWQVSFDGEGQPSLVLGTCQDITERKLAEDELRASEARFQTFMDNSPAVAFIMDEQSRFVYMNQPFEKQVGVKLSEVRGKSIFDVWPEEIARPLHEHNLSVLAADSASRLLEEVPISDGEMRCWSVWKFPLLDASGQCLIAGFGLDVTEEERNIVALHESEERFRAFMDNTPARVFMKNHKGQYVYMNKASERLWGTPASDLMGKTIFAHFPQKIAEEIHQNDLQVFATGQPHQFEEIITSAEGQVHHEFVSKFLLTDAKGDQLLAGVAINITEQKQAENERDRFFTMSLDMLAIAGLDGYFKRVNPAFSETLGYTEAELMAKPTLEFVHPEDQARTLAARENLLVGGMAVGLENRYRCKDGSWRWFEWKSVAAVEEGVIYAAARDITERKKAEAALQKANDELELHVMERTAELAAANESLRVENIEHQMTLAALRQAAEALEKAREDADAANQAKSEFLSRMSHELRTPLNAILGYGQILEMHEDVSDIQEEVDTILKAGRHLLELINEVLEIARIEAGHLSLSPEPVPVQEVVQVSLDLVRPIATPRQIQLFTEGFAAKNATNHAGHHVFADQQRLRQVLVNLLSNAIKYNRDRGRVTISTSIVPGETTQYGEVECRGKMRFSVRDTGPGISPDNISKLFIPFERLGAERTRIEGTGIGLTLCKQLIEAMHGEIGVESVPGEGSTFWVELPLVSAALETVPATEEVALPATVLRENELTILYIEDNISNFAVVKRAFAMQEKAINLLGAEQGSVGLDMACGHLPDLILLDLHLPDIMGDVVLQRLRSEPSTRAIPVIIVSADATSGQIERLLAAGATAYLTKPLDLKKFFLVVGQTLDESRR